MAENATRDIIRPREVRDVATLKNSLEKLALGDEQVVKGAAATLKKFVTADNHSILSPRDGVYGINLVTPNVRMTFEQGMIRALNHPYRPQNGTAARELAVEAIINGTSEVSNIMISTVSKLPETVALSIFSDVRSKLKVSDVELDRNIIRAETQIQNKSTMLRKGSNFTESHDLEHAPVA